MCVCLSHRSTAATAAGGFAAERGRLQLISFDSWCAQQQNAGSVLLRAEGYGSTQTCFGISFSFYNWPILHLSTSGEKLLFFILGSVVTTLLCFSVDTFYVQSRAANSSDIRLALFSCIYLMYGAK